MALARIAALALLLVSVGGCTIPVGRTTSTPAGGVGDTCLVGTWTLVEETNQHGYSLANNPVAVSGLAGSTLTITTSGSETEDFQGSQPLIGALPDGKQLAITIGGSFEFHITANSGTYTEAGQKVQLPTTATVNDQPVTYHSSYSPGTGTYECSSSSLTMTSKDGNQTTQWSKG